MNTLMKLLMGVLVLAVIFIDIRFGWLFGHSLGHTTEAAFALSSLGALVTAIKALSLVVTIQAIWAKNWWATAAGIVVVIATTGYSVASNIGYSGVNREAASQSIANKSADKKSATDAMQRHVIALASVPAHRPAGAINADLSILPDNPKGVETRLKKAALVGELANAVEADRLSALIDIEREKSEAKSGDAATSDPQVTAISEVTGWSIPNIKMILAAAVPFVIEVVTLLGPVAVVSTMPNAPKMVWPYNKKAPATPASPVRKMIRIPSGVRKWPSSTAKSAATIPQSDDASDAQDETVAEKPDRSKIIPLIRALPQHQVDELNAFFRSNLVSTPGGFEMSAGMAAEAEAHLGFAVTPAQAGAILSAAGHESQRFAGMRGFANLRYIGERKSDFTLRRTSMRATA